MSKRTRRRTGASTGGKPEGFLYLAVVLDLFSRRVVGWSMQPTMSRDLVMQALLSALWRRRPTGTVLVHSDQRSQYGSQDYLAFLAEHNLEPSMSRRGNCLDNAVVESLFSTLKKLRIRRRIYATQDDARADIFDFIELFYNRFDNGDTATSAACPRGSLRPTILRGSRVSRKSWAFHTYIFTGPRVGYRMAKGRNSEQ